MNNQGWISLGLTGLISLLFKGLTRVFFNTTVWKYQFFRAQPSLWSNSHIHTWLLEKVIALTIQTVVVKVKSVLLNMLSRFVTAFLPRSKHLLISWLQSPSAVILESKKMKSDTVSTFPPSICHEGLGPDTIISFFWMLSFKPVFSLSSFIFIKRSSVPLHFLPLEWYHMHIRGCWYFSHNLNSSLWVTQLSICMMYSAYKLNKQGDNTQPWCTPFPIWNQSIFPCPVLTVPSCPAYRLLRRQITWSGISISKTITVCCDPHSQRLQHSQFSRIPWFLKIPLLFLWSSICWHLISGSSAFSKSSLYIYKFSVHVLLKPRLKDFEHNFARIWNECMISLYSDLNILWHCLTLGLERYTHITDYCSMIKRNEILIVEATWLTLENIKGWCLVLKGHILHVFIYWNVEN